MIFKSEDFEIAHIGNKRIIVKGIGKSFYQDGFPIAMCVTMVVRYGFDVSVLHIADELLNNKWKPERVINVLKNELSDTIVGDVQVDLDIQNLIKFCNASYEDQREMIFKSLFVDKDFALNWLRNTMSKKET